MRQRSHPARAKSSEVVHSARSAAVQAVVAALSGRSYAKDELRRIGAAGALEAGAVALADALAIGTLRHFAQCETILLACARYQPRHTPAAMRALLASAVFQIVWLDSIPEYAAVDESVSLARVAGGAGAARLANALLRSVCREIAERRVSWEPLNRRHVRVGWERACQFSRDLLPAPEPRDAHVGSATGLPRALLGRLWVTYGAEQAAAAAWASQFEPPIVLQRNPRQISAQAFAESVRAAFGPATEISPDTDRAYVRDTAGMEKMELIATGQAWVQDETARAAARVLQPAPGERVLDLCAAPGGKTIALAVEQDDAGTILACDVSAQRLARVEENTARLGLRSVRTRALRERGGSAGLLAELGESEPFDAVLVDAPCSNSGVLARRPEARMRQGDRVIARLCALQRAILGRAAVAVRPGGRLLYSTCSIDARENDENTAWFLRTFPGWVCERSETALPTCGPSAGDWRDGGFVALLRRPSGPRP